MHFAHERIICFPLGERHGFEMQKRNFLRRQRRKRAGMAKSYKREGHFTLGIDIQQAIHVAVDKAAHDPRRQTQSSGDGEKISEERAILPAEMAGGGPLNMSRS